MAAKSLGWLNWSRWFLDALSRRATRYAVAVALLCIMDGLSAAYGQFMSTRGLQCGDQELTFDQLGSSSETANSARQKELQSIYSYAWAAFERCNDPPTAGSIDLPGCASVRTWVNTHRPCDAPPMSADCAVDAAKHRLAQDGTKVADLTFKLKTCMPRGRTCADVSVALAAAKPEVTKDEQVLRAAEQKFIAERDGDLTQRAQRLGNDLEMVLNAKRVLAHSLCSSSRNTSIELKNSCSALVKAELANHAPAVDADQFYAPIDIQSRGDRVVSEAVAQRVEDIPFSAELMDLKEGIKANCKAAGPLRDESSRIDARVDDCTRATFYINSNGHLVYQPQTRSISSSTQVDHVACDSTTVQTICVDSADYALDEPMTVEVTQSPVQGLLSVDVSDSPTDAARSSSSLKIWPGERAELPPMLCNAITRISVRGFPRRAVLRVASGGTSAGSGNSFDPIQLLADSRKIENDRKRTHDEEADAAALDGFVSYLNIHSSFATDTSDAMASLADGKKVSAAGLKKANKVLAEVRDAFDKYQKTDPRPKEMTVATIAFVSQPLRELPPSTTLEDAQKSMKDLVQLASTVAAKATDLQTDVQKVTDLETAQKVKLGRVCEIAQTLVPFIDEDVLMQPAHVNTYVVDYDFKSGYLGSEITKLADTDNVFVRVHHVRPGYGVSVNLDDAGVVQHSVSLAGFTPPSGNADKTALPKQDTNIRPSSLSEDPAVQPDTTQILALGRLDGGRRYSLAVCAETEAQTSCDAPSGGTAQNKPSANAGRSLGHNTLIVHSKRYLGVRAGFGEAEAFGDFRELDRDPGSNLQVVRSHDVGWDFALPVLLTLYLPPTARDAVTGPPVFSYGVAAGLDVLKIGKTPRLYFGAVVDVCGFGVTGGITAERISSVDAPEGTSIPLGGGSSSRDGWYPGAFVAVTTDLDIFQAIFNSYFSTQKFPSTENEK